MNQLQDLGADALCNIVVFATGAEIVALLQTARCIRATLVGPLARKHFKAMSVARWGEGCRCQYAVAAAGTKLPRAVVDESDYDHYHGATGASARNSYAADSGDGDDDRSGDKPHTTGNNSNNSPDEEEGRSDSGGGGGADWLAFYLRRVGHRAARPSPLNLLQEHYAEDAYRLLSCCILCSRTSGGDTVKDAVEAFFEACPTPTSVLAADLGELRKTLLPLGLNRELIIKRFAEGFLASAWHDPSELHGCGRFASDSWQIFCLGNHRPGNQVIDAAATAAAATAAPAALSGREAAPAPCGNNGGASKKKKKVRSGGGGGGRRGPLDRNLAAYCRFAERRRSSDEGGVTTGGDALGAGEPAPATTASSTNKKRRRKTVLVAEEDGPVPTVAKRTRNGGGDSAPNARQRRRCGTGGGAPTKARGAAAASEASGSGGARRRLPVGRNLSSGSTREERALRRRRGEAAARG
ncbi:unnamed protein product [Ectocarpus sp. 4 AP-2014]